MGAGRWQSTVRQSRCIGQGNQSATLQIHKRLAATDLLRASIGTEPIKPTADKTRQSTASHTRLSHRRPNARNHRLAECPPVQMHEANDILKLVQ